MKFTALIAGLVAVASVTFSAAASAEWEKGHHGQVAPGSLEIGQEGGETLYLCRADYKGGMHPGKVRKAFKGCNIGWGGKEIAIPDYETKVIWKRAARGDVPPGAEPAGREGNKDLFACRAMYKGGMHAGKVRRDFKGCNIGWGGAEVAVEQYEVLMR